MLQQLKTSETEDLRCCHFSNVRLKPFREGHKEHYYVKLACGGVEVGPIPSNFILQKERPVCISIEGHGDHFVKRVMQWCRVNFGVVLLLVIVVSTTGVPMSPGHGGYQTATPPSYYQTTSNATTSLLHRGPQVLLCSQPPSYYQRLLTTSRSPSIKPRPTRPPATTLKLRISIFVVVLLLGVLSLLAGRPLVYRTPPSGRNSREAQEMIQDEKVVLKEREKAKEISRVNISDPATTAAQYLSSTAFFQFSIMVTMASFYRWLSFIAESTTVAPMSHGYGGYQTATSVPNYTTYATTGYYTEAHKYYNAPAYFTIEAHKYCTTKAPEYYTTSHAAPASTPTLQNTTPPENRSTTRLRMLPQLSTPAYYTEAPKYSSAPAYYTEALNTTLYPATYPQLRRPIPTYYTVAATSYYVDPNYYSEVPVYYTKIYTAPSYYTGAPVYCNTKESEYYTTTYAFPTYYTEAAKYFTAPSYHTIKAAEYLSVIP
ncbi:hypothetical protein DAPPUDRAFT_237699 [Daphnia pulex]|uniref:Uncharacterized protein n=1 Tax=Daphnia pulex TaxID=6669 RepID=E9G5M7_DAPPU|nr:hypothetical protein DAPPUDRAFT_237699 [Daphnia pulex]|eukprot:EFX85601.1 hypothetical protein DAPPUDRAFT_237699 [Daphnia pulex]